MAAITSPGPVSPLSLDYDEDVLRVDMRTYGESGLNRAAGIVSEEVLPQLDGQAGMRIYRDMADNEPFCAALLMLVDKLCRGVTFTVETASGQPYDREVAEFTETALHDMRYPFSEHISEFLSMIPYGHAACELVYKRRAGKNPDANLNSKYRDGRVGWQYIPLRSQDSIIRWHFDRAGNIIGFEQQAPPNFNFVSIPIEKCLLFRTQNFKNSPLGKSVFRGAYEPWYFKRALSRLEGIGAERDLAGVPVALVPPEILSTKATPNQKQLLAVIQNIVRNLKQNEQSCVVFPMAYDENGKPLFELKLMASAGSRQFDTDKIIQRYNRDISLCLLGDFLTLGGAGSGASGSWAMHSDKTKMFVQVINTFLDIIVEEFNRHAIPRLLDLNSFRMSDYPQLRHSGLEKTDLKEVGTYLQALAAAGMPLFPNTELQGALLDLANLPKPTELEDISQVAEVQPMPGTQDPKKVVEEHDPESRQEPEPASRPQGSASAFTPHPAAADAATTAKNFGRPGAR